MPGLDDGKFGERGMMQNAWCVNGKLTMDELQRADFSVVVEAEFDDNARRKSGDEFGSKGIQTFQGQSYWVSGGEGSTMFEILGDPIHKSGNHKASHYVYIKRTLIGICHVAHISHHNPVWSHCTRHLLRPPAISTPLSIPCSGQNVARHSTYMVITIL